MKIDKTGTVDLETKRLKLRRFTLDDAQDMFDNWASDPEVTIFPMTPPLSFHSIAQFMNPLSSYRLIQSVSTFRETSTLACVGQVRNLVTSGSEAQFLYMASASAIVSLLNTSRPVSILCVPQWFMEISFHTLRANRSLQPMTVSPNVSGIPCHYIGGQFNMGLRVGKSFDLLRRFRSGSGRRVIARRAGKGLLAAWIIQFPNGQAARHRPHACLRPSFGINALRIRLQR